MTNIETYYRGLISILESRLVDIEGIIFDIRFQLKDDKLEKHHNQEWRTKARFKLRCMNEDLSKTKLALKSKKHKLHIARGFNGPIGAEIKVSKLYVISCIESEITSNIMRAKLRELLGLDNYAEFMKENVRCAQEAIKLSATAHFDKSNRLPAAIDIYNWKDK